MKNGISKGFNREDRVFVSVASRLNREIESGRLTGPKIKLDRKARRLSLLLDRKGFQPTEEEAGAVLAGLVGKYQENEGVNT